MTIWLLSLITGLPCYGAKASVLVRGICVDALISDISLKSGFFCSVSWISPPKTRLTPSNCVFDVG